MSLLLNSLLEVTVPDGSQEIVRVIHFDRKSGTAYVIRIDRSNALPDARRLSEIEDGLADKRIRVLTIDPFAYLQMPEEAIPAKHRRRRDAAWAIIESIVTAQDHTALDPDRRGQLIREAIQKVGSTKKHVYRYLRRYWQSGMTRNALLPYFHLCGARGKERKLGHSKRGRPRYLTQLKGAPPGINIGSAEAEKLRKGYRMFYRKAAEDGGETLKSAHRQTLRKFFYAGFAPRDGTLVEVLPPADELPTFAQFLYWARKGENIEERLFRRNGERKFNLTLRPVLGDSTLMAYGPGSIYQIDATMTDFWAVSSLNRARRLARLTTYFVVDTFSHLISGFHAGLENSSFFASGLALENATADKVAYCAQFGIEIAPEEWPSMGLPEAILADRGEMEGHDASNIVNSLGIRVSNTSPYRADMKGIVERTFRSMNDLLVHSLPGAVRKPKERGERDPRLDAALTLKEYRILLIRSILLHNQRRIETYRLQPEMIADNVEPRATAVWGWGIVNRSGHLRQADSNIIRGNLLPGAKATVTYQGIKYRGLYYACDRAMREGWFTKARASRSWQIDVVFDPRTVDTLLVRLPNGGGLEPCHLTEADRRFAGKPWEEIDDFWLVQKEDRDQSKTADLQSRVNHRAQVDAVVGNALKEAAAANQGLTKAARRNGVRENRKAERLQDWSQTVAVPPTLEPKPGNGSEAIATESKPESDYVPPVLDLKMLRKQREARWNDNE
jgi:putative transposase